MPTETNLTVRTKAFTYKGKAVGPLELSLYIFSDLESNKKARDLVALGSLNLLEGNTFYEVGQDLWIYQGKDLPTELETLPDSVKIYGVFAFQDAMQKKSRGGWHASALEYLKCPLNERGARKAHVYHNIGGFNQQDGTPIETDALIIVKDDVWIPKSGVAVPVPTGEGTFELFDSRTGAYLETVDFNDRDAQRQRWKAAYPGLTDEKADDLVSVHMRTEGNDFFTVDSFSDPSGGPRYVKFFAGHDNMCSYSGRYPVSRLPSGASHDPEISILTSEYRELLEAKKQRDAGRDALKA